MSVARNFCPFRSRTFSWTPTSIRDANVFQTSGGAWHLRPVATRTSSNTTYQQVSCDTHDEMPPASTEIHTHANAPHSGFGAVRRQRGQHVGANEAAFRHIELETAGHEGPCRVPQMCLTNRTLSARAARRIELRLQLLGLAHALDAHSQERMHPAVFEELVREGRAEGRPPELVFADRVRRRRVERRHGGGWHSERRCRRWRKERLTEDAAIGRGREIDVDLDVRRQIAPNRGAERPDVCTSRSSPEPGRTCPRRATRRTRPRPSDAATPGRTS